MNHKTGKHTEQTSMKTMLKLQKNALLISRRY